MKNVFLVLALLLAIIIVPACENKAGEKQETGNTVSGEEMATDSTQTLAYVCPMKCEGSGRNEPGKCSVCDMDLVKNQAHQDHNPAAGDSTAQQVH